MTNIEKAQVKHNAIRKSVGDRIFDTFNTILLLMLCFITLYPMWYVLCASFTKNSYLVAHPGAIFWPHGFNVGSYKLAFSHPLILSGYKNILIVLAVSLPINIALTLFCGYFLASKNVLLKKPVLFIIMFTMFFNGGMIPSYLNVRDLGLYNGAIRTGKFGEMTTKAVASFQKKNGLKDTGIADPATLERLESEWAKLGLSAQ